MPPGPFPETVSHLSLSGDGTFLGVAGSDPVLKPNGTWVHKAMVMTSDDRGTTWNRSELPGEFAQEIPDGTPTMDLALSRDGRRLVVGVAGGACLSEDRGLTWRVIRNPVESWTEWVALSADGTTVAVDAQGVDAEGNSAVQLLLSTDSAATWHLLPWNGVAVPPYLSRLELGEDGRRIVAVHPYGPLLISGDQGQSWLSLALNLWPTAVAVSPHGIHVLSGTPYGPHPGIDSPGPVNFASDSGQTQESAQLGWVPLVALSTDGSVQVGAMPSGVILINGVLFPPTILDTRREGDLGLIGDRSVTLGITATGGRLNYQWRRDGTPLADGPGRSGTQSEELKLTSVSEADLGTYSVVVSNAEGSAEQEVFTLKLEAPTISNAVQTGSAALVDGATVAFGAEVTGGLLSYQWRRNGVDLEDAPGRTGSHTRKLTLTASSAADLGIYSLLVSNAAGSVTTNVGELKLTLPLVIVTQPRPGAAVVPGDSTRMQVQVEGGQIEVEWLLNGLPLEQAGVWVGPGTNVLELTHLQPAEMGRYAVRLRNPLGEIVAEVAQVSAASWSRANVPAVPWNGVAVSAAGDRVVACAADRVVTSDFQRGIWESLPVAGSNWTSVALGSSSGRVILGQGSEVLRSYQTTSGFISSDSGSSWKSWTDARSDGEWGVWQTKSVASSAGGRTLLVSQDNGFAAGFPGSLRRISRLRVSRDGGLTWRTASSNYREEEWRSVSCSADGRSMVAVRSLSYAIRFIQSSVDSGATWTESTLPESLIRAVQISGDGKRLVAIAGQHLYATDSSNIEWQRLSAPAANWVALTLSHDGQRIFAADYGSATGAGTIHQSDDGGQTWRWSGSPSANWTALGCSADGERVVGASSQGLFLSPDWGTPVVSAVPLRAARDSSGIRVVWQGTPHRTYRLISTQNLGGQPWLNAGAVVADGEGRVTIAEPANGAQRFWQALDVGE
jgi:hypothetical protein